MSSQTTPRPQAIGSQSYIDSQSGRRELPYGSWPGLHESTLPEDAEPRVIASPPQELSSTSRGTKRARSSADDAIDWRLQLLFENQQRLEETLKTRVLSDRQKAIQIIKDFAVTEGWGHGRFDRALDLVHNGAYVDIIVMLSQKQREAWLARKVPSEDNKEVGERRGSVLQSSMTTQYPSQPELDRRLFMDGSQLSVIDVAKAAAEHGRSMLLPGLLLL